MGGGSAKDLVRWVRTLHESGAVGGFSDAGLVERFASRGGTDREDAFTALVHRHGPMVQRVCRRMLADPADADDAFQAVFLVLARKAGSLRRAEDLKSWLYGVAVRTSLEARKRAARLRVREGAPLDDSVAAIARDEPFELRALLDEELNRLPNRLREPLLLCELEGISRQEAARRLGLPEGTLSSRLARGRSLLRDRLTRRGVAVGALGAMLPAPAMAAATLDASLRLALKFAARDAGAGAVPAAVVSLAEGVIQMIHAAKLKTVLLASSTLVAACLAAGLVAGRASPFAEAPQKPVAQAAESSNQDKPAEPLMARGVVVDEAGNPVAGAVVRIGAYEPGERSTVSGPDGAFAIPAPEDGLDGRRILADFDGGRALGLFHYGPNLTGARSREPVRVVVKPSRELAVRVVDSSNAPVEGAAVEVVGYYYALAQATTGADGVANVRVPSHVQISWIVAQKGRVGFDYAEFGEFNAAGTALRGVPPEKLADPVALTLEPARVARIKAVDQYGEPMAGVGFMVWQIRKDGRRSVLNHSSRQRVATTDADGIATFDWLPQEEHPFSVVPVAPRFARSRATIGRAQTDPVVVTLLRNQTIRGRVVLPNGSPAKDVKVLAEGAGVNGEPGRATTRSNEDGTYVLSVPPNEAYAISVDDGEWAAVASLDVAVRPKEPVDGVDFQLAKPIIFRGTVTAGADRHPAVGTYVQLHELGFNIPKDLVEGANRPPPGTHRVLTAVTDARGRYEFRVGPGVYDLKGPERIRLETIKAVDQAEVVRNLHVPDLSSGPLSGRVVAASERVIPASEGRPIAGARVVVISANNYGPPVTVTADDEGRFQADRILDDAAFLCGWSPDGSLGGVGYSTAGDREALLILSPTASATGRLLDEEGEPAANRELEWGRRVYLWDERRSTMEQSFAFAKVATDDEGRFTLPALVTRTRYDIGVKGDPRSRPIGVVVPEEPGPIDLGTLRIGSPESR